MIYVFTALYSEAAPLIECFSLTENKDFKYKTYTGEDGIQVTVTGIGPVKAAAAVGSVFTTREPAETDMMVNIGICAGDTVDAEGEVSHQLFVINKLSNVFASRDFYPDMVLRNQVEIAGVPDSDDASEVHSVTIAERSLMTVARPVGPSDIEAGRLYDMEGAAVYEAASQFMAPHQMSFLKIVSDMGETAGLTPAKVSDIVRGKLPEIKGYLENIRAFSEEVLAEIFGSDENEPSANNIYAGNSESAIAQKLSEALKCSKTMGEELKVLLHFYKTSGNEPFEIYEKLLDEGAIPVNSKRDGKKVLDKIRADIIQ